MKVTNRSSATTIYRIPEDHIKRKFAPGETKFDITEDEIRKLAYSKGGLAILKDNLLIDDKEIIAKYISNSVEPEYWFTEKEIKDLMLYGELDRFLDCLDFAPEGVIDIIKSLAISLPLTDTRKIEAIKDKTGFNVANALENFKEDKVQEQEVKTRRVSENSMATSTPQRRYTILDK